MDTQKLQDLVNDLRQAGINEFGDVGSETFPTAYFNSKVEILGPNKTINIKEFRAAKFCATNYGAARLSEAFNAAGTGYTAIGSKLENAENEAGMQFGWVDSEPVPWLIFQDDDDLTTVNVNAGTMLDLINHGRPARNTIADLINEVEKGFMNAAMEANKKPDMVQTGPADADNDPSDISGKKDAAAKAKAEVKKTK